MVALSSHEVVDELNRFGIVDPAEVEIVSKEYSVFINGSPREVLVSEEEKTA